MDDSPNMSPEELTRRVLYSLLRPAINVAEHGEVPLGELSEWAELAYFHSLRESGLKMREVAGQLDVSMRKAAQLSARLKQNFLDPERSVGLPRRIEFMLWAEPLSLARLYQVLPTENPDDIDASVQDLLDHGRIEARPGARVTYAVTDPSSRLVRDTWTSRIDGLNHLSSTVAAAVIGRFFEADESAFARTVGLRVRREDEAALRDLYEQTIWPALLALDAAAAEDPDAVTVNLALLWAQEPRSAQNDTDKTPSVPTDPENS